MLSTLNRDSGRASWRMRVVLAASGLAVLALPGLYLSRAELAQAELQEAAEPAETAEPTEGAKSADAVAPAAAPDPTPKAESPARILLPSADSTQQFNPTPAPATFEPKTKVIPEPKAIPEPNVEYFPEPTDVEKRINEALDTRATFEFTETPLIDAMMVIKGKLGNEIEIQLDNRALEDAGVSGDSPVTRNLKNVPIRTALRLMLSEYDLTSLIQDEVLLITTVDKAETELVTRTYPVGDLVPEVTVTSAKGAAPKAKSSGGGRGMFAVADDESPAAHFHRPTEAKPVADKTETTTKRDFDTLIKAITTTVKPQTWDEVGGPGSILAVPVSSSLVISQTRDVHDEVLQLLRALRAAKRASDVRAVN